MLTICKRMIIGGKYRWKKKLISNLGIAGLFPTGRQPLVRRRGSVWAELAHREPVTWPRGLRHRGFHRSSPIRRRSGTLLDQLGRIFYSRIQRWPALCFHQQHQVFLTAFLRKKSILKIKMNHQIFIIKSITGDFNWFRRDHPRELCLTARNAKPYPVLPAGTPDRPRLQLHYTICSAPDLRAVHQVRAIQQSTIYRCFFFLLYLSMQKKKLFLIFCRLQWIIFGKNHVQCRTSVCWLTRSGPPGLFTSHQSIKAWWLNSPEKSETTASITGSWNWMTDGRPVTDRWRLISSSFQILHSWFNNSINRWGDGPPGCHLATTVASRTRFLEVSWLISSFRKEWVAVIYNWVRMRVVMLHCWCLSRISWWLCGSTRSSTWNATILLPRRVMWSETPKEWRPLINGGILLPLRLISISLDPRLGDGGMPESLA